LIGLFLAAACLIAYWPAFSNGFVNYDDPEYVTDNPPVRAGLTWEGISWAFAHSHSSNWHPLTWISHMLDVEIYGLNPMGHHLSSVVLHILNTLLLFLVLGRMTGCRWRSAFVAALFAVHPLHVESVAWIAERKDVLSTLFWMLVMLAYASGRPILVILLYALGLMAKPMLVTLPLILLLMDWWPLERVKRQGWKRLFLEKTPLLAMAAASSAVTIVVQQRSGAVGALDAIPFGLRASNALVSYVGYIGKMLWPRKLAVFYPHPENTLPSWHVALAVLVLLIISVLVLSSARRRPYLAFGWLWYLITLIPVIGLVQVGKQAMADRYTYIPLIGLFIAITWGLSEVSAGWRVRMVRTAAACAGCVVLIVLTRIQTAFWYDSAELFRHALSVTSNNDVAHSNLGIALREEGDIEEAARQFRLALEIDPRQVEARTNLGLALAELGRTDEAITEYEKALNLDPDAPQINHNHAVALAAKRRMKEAIAHERAALRLRPGFAEAHSALGGMLHSQGRMDEAIDHCRQAIRLKPDLADAHNNLAVLLYFKGDYAEAWREVRLAERYGFNPNPGFIAALSSRMPPMRNKN